MFATASEIALALPSCGPGGPAKGHHSRDNVRQGPRAGEEEFLTQNFVDLNETQRDFMASSLWKRIG